MNIYVGNLGYSVSEDELREVFSPFGEVTKASIITDRDSGQSKGFGFVGMASADAAKAAIAGLNGKELKGRAMTVNEARPRAERPSGGDRGGRGGGGGGGGGGRRW
jgi:cold-inducible RNA-binding protein